VCARSVSSFEARMVPVDRWWPGIERQTIDEIRFGEAAHLLFELAGHTHADGC